MIVDDDEISDTITRTVAASLPQSPPLQSPDVPQSSLSSALSPPPSSPTSPISTLQSPRELNCQICLDLQWEFFIPPVGLCWQWKEPHEIQYYDLLDSDERGCQACTLLGDAILEFSKPLMKNQSNFLELLLSSSVMIWLRVGYTTIVGVWEQKWQEKGINGPLFSLELYTQAGEL